MACRAAEDSGPEAWPATAASHATSDAAPGTAEGSELRQSLRYEHMGLTLTPGVAVRPGYGQESDTVAGVYNSQIRHMDMRTLRSMAEEGHLVEWAPGCAPQTRERSAGSTRGGVPRQVHRAAPPRRDAAAATAPEALIKVCGTLGAANEAAVSRVCCR